MPSGHPTNYTTLTDVTQNDASGISRKWFTSMTRRLVKRRFWGCSPSDVSDKG